MERKLQKVYMLFVYEREDAPCNSSYHRVSISVAF
jgi:hypothetical protein